MAWTVERNDTVARPLKNITPDEVPDAMRAASYARDLIARAVAENSGADACTILGTTPDIVEAIREYAKPRWPELF